MSIEKSTPDMWELVSAVYLHGANLATLETVMPKWKRCEIEHVLRRFKRRAERDRMLMRDGINVRSSSSTSKIKWRVECQSLTSSNKGVGSTINPNTKLGFTASRANFDRSSNSSSKPALLSWAQLVQKVHVIQGSALPHRLGAKSKCPLKNYAELFSKVMLYSACFEDHYHGGQEEDTCYSEIYRYLSQLLSGEEPTQLRRRSAAKVLELLDRLAAIAEQMETHVHHLCAIDFKKMASTPAPDASTNEYAYASIPLFEDSSMKSEAEENLEAACAALDVTDPYYEEAKKALCSKLLSHQRRTGTQLSELSGINPLRVPPALLQMPVHTMPHHYPSRINKHKAASHNPAAAAAAAATAV